MDKGTWQATVQGVERVRHNLATKLQQQNEDNSSSSVGLFAGLNELAQHLARGGGFPAGSNGKESACKAGDMDSIPGSERFPRQGNGYPLQ